ncbi:hypothetical protein [uncultured Maritimibacter sp.]|jgi:hypothetical protein|uniref:hypothetical protein n=1 Tax=uncultured Maritimibacter sp. TaxID=991866 RepID=UPI00261618E4|nr:hypothetical protein [uncultured Maritimibacter sp.]
MKKTTLILATVSAFALGAPAFAQSNMAPMTCEDQGCSAAEAALMTNGMAMLEADGYTVERVVVHTDNTVTLYGTSDAGNRQITLGAGGEVMADAMVDSDETTEVPGSATAESGILIEMESDVDESSAALSTDLSGAVSGDAAGEGGNAAADAGAAVSGDLSVTSDGDSGAAEAGVSSETDTGISIDANN